jgi:cytidylate kinase
MKHTTIILFGFSGSGKSTIANMLGKELSLRVVHPSSVLKDLIKGNIPNINNSKEGKGFWESSDGIRMFKDRLKHAKPIDLVCDKLLLKEIYKGNLVMDSWSIPWLTDRGIKIYLKTTNTVRTARVSQRSPISTSQAKKTVTMKDNGTRNLYLEHRGFDIKKDHQVFDMDRYHQTITE